jgi:beta-aspartyl-dipeptidase (metallo-type)
MGGKETHMVTLVKSGSVFGPDPLGRRDVLILADRIGAVAEPDSLSVKGLEIEELDAEGKYVIPAMIDSHVHILGGGGEGGPATRAPEITMEDVVSSGVATLIGCLGTDGTTRHMESLLAKAYGLENEGINTYIFSGSYEIPVKTLTTSVRSDLILIPKVVGAGEIALSDHRSAQPTFQDFAKLAAECRVGGMLGGKAGILHCHMGSGLDKLAFVHRLLEETEIPATQVIPTHINRNHDLLEDSTAFIKKGGRVDLTADIDPASDEDIVSIASSVRYYMDKGLSLEQVSVSSDSNGSLPVFDEKGNLSGLTIATEKSLLENFRYLVKENVLPLEQTIRLFSSNPARFYGFEGKGRIEKGMDADILLLDQEFRLTDSFIAGRRMMSGGELLARGTFS